MYQQHPEASEQEIERAIWCFSREHTIQVPAHAIQVLLRSLLALFILSLAASVSEYDEPWKAGRVTQKC